VIYAPGEHTGYAAVVIPGVNEAIENNNLTLTKQQLQIVTASLNRAAGALEMVK
jgi:N-acetylated-alpha-linked acidic dipeptidase